MNQLATQILDAAVDEDRGGAVSRVRARAAAQGVLEPVAEVRVSAAQRRRAIDGMAGVGPVLDELLDDDRDRR